MEETFYAVQQVINGRSGTQPTIFSSLDDAREYATMLDGMADKHRSDDFKIEYRLYEVKELKW